MKQVIKQNLTFLFPYLLFLIATGFFLLLNSKAEAHLILNKYHFRLLDLFFSYITYLGDFTMAIICSLLLIMHHWRSALFFAVSNCLSGGTTQLLKHFVFDDMVRPKKYFENMASLNLVDGVDVNSYNTFPSGHATTAFTICFCLVLLTTNKLLKFILFLAALLISYSRVYLSQHFLNDVYAGSLIGITFSLLTYYFFFVWKKNETRVSKQ